MSLRLKIWLYFVLFTVLVFILLWIFQVLFLEHFYEKMKVVDVKQAAEELIDEYGSSNYEDVLTKVANDNDLCIEILDKYGRSKYSREVMGDCLIHGRGNVVRKYIPEILSADGGEIYYKAQSNMGNEVLLYGYAIGGTENPEAYLFLTECSLL